MATDEGIILYGNLVRYLHYIHNFPLEDAEAKAYEEYQNSWGVPLRMMDMQKAREDEAKRIFNDLSNIKGIIGSTACTILTKDLLRIKEKYLKKEGSS